MASERAVIAAALLCAVVVLGAFARPATAQTATPRSSIYSCVDANGKRIIAASPIPGCRDREQRELNPDGSTRRIVPPVPTAEERADAEQRERDRKMEEQTINDAIRRDRNLVNRFPNEQRHQKAREESLDNFRASVRTAEARLDLLKKERKPLLDDAEFYVGKALPASLRQRLDANDASQKAIESSIQNANAEVIRINALYDAELARLRKLWAGAPAGSVPIASDLKRTNLR